MGFFCEVAACGRAKSSNIRAGSSNKTEKVLIYRWSSNIFRGSSNKWLRFSNIAVRSSNKSLRFSNKLEKVLIKQFRRTRSPPWNLIKPVSSAKNARTSNIAAKISNKSLKSSNKPKKVLIKSKPDTPHPKKSHPKVLYQLQDSLSDSHSLLFLLFILHKRKYDHRNPNHNNRYKNVKVFRRAG